MGLDDELQLELSAGRQPISRVWSVFSSVEGVRQVSPSTLSIISQGSEALRNTLENALNSLASELTRRPGDIEAAHAWCVALEHPENSKLLRSALIGIGGLSVKNRDKFQIQKHWGELAQNHLAMCQDHIEVLHAARAIDVLQCKTTNDMLNDRLADDDHLLLKALSEWDPNEPRLEAPCRRSRIEGELVRPGTSLLSYPYLLDAASKQRFLRAETRTRATLKITVRREFIIEDARGLLQAQDEELKKQLKVSFTGEDAVDEGGVANEFMHVALRQLFNDFAVDDESQTLWLQQGECELVGILLGMAVRNSILVDAPFPSALWKKLVGEPLTFNDLAQAFPASGRSLLAVLQDPDSMDLHFDNGDKVTTANAQHYVDTYVDWKLNTSIKDQFESFQRGFDRVVGGNVWRLLTAEDLELLICGSNTLDFDQLKLAAIYEGYDESSLTISHFWTVVDELQHNDKLRFLKFVTGSDRAPINGLASARFVLSRTAATEQLPSSHTCFSHLVLPDYQDLAVLRTKLTIAITESYEGFGLR